MKLTNYIRDAYVNQAMNDVPSVDYYEQYRALVTKFVVGSLPKEVRAIWDNPKLRAFVKTSYWHRGVTTVYIPYAESSEVFTPTPEQQGELDALVLLLKEQDATHSALRGKLRGAAYSCTTRKALAELLPEFVDYLPGEFEVTTRRVPVIANLMSDMVKAGWPKGKQEAAAAP